MASSLQLINMPPFSPLQEQHVSSTHFSLLLSPSACAASSLFFHLCHSQLVTTPSLLTLSFLPPSLPPRLGALMASMYSSPDTATSAGREGLFLTTQPANEIFPHLINTIRILILTESI